MRSQFIISALNFKIWALALPALPIYNTSVMVLMWQSWGFSTLQHILAMN